MKILLVLLLLIFSFSGRAAHWLDPQYDPYSGFDLVQALLKDDETEYAQTVLNEIKINSPEKMIVFHFWQGQIAFQKKQWTQAIEAWTQIPLTTNNELALKLGEAHSYNLNHKKAVFYFEQHRYHPNLLQVQEWSKSLVALGQWAEAISLLKPWIAKETQILRIWCQILIQNHSTRTAYEQVKSLYSENIYNSSDYIQIAEIFYENQKFEEAFSILRLGLINNPQNLDLNLALIPHYFRKGWLQSAEHAFVTAAHIDSQYFYQAAEMARQNKNWVRARQLNRRISDPQQQLKQHIALAVDQQNYTEIASLESRITRSPLMNDDEILYALAYSLIQAGEHQRSLSYLNTIRSSQLMDKVLHLRKSLMGIKI